MLILRRFVSFHRIDRIPIIMPSPLPALYRSIPPCPSPRSSPNSTASLTNPSILLPTETSIRSLLPHPRHQRPARPPRPKQPSRNLFLPQLFWPYHLHLLFFTLRLLPRVRPLLHPRLPNPPHRLPIHLLAHLPLPNRISRPGRYYVRHPPPLHLVLRFGRRPFPAYLSGRGILLPPPVTNRPATCTGFVVVYQVR